LCNQLHTCIETWGIHTHHTYVILKYINKGKTPSKGTRKEKRKDQSPNKRTHQKAQNAQWGAQRGEIKKPRT
jgi:hypothetical protein